MIPSPLHHVTRPEDAGARLDKVLAAQMPELSRTRLQALISEGRVTLDGQTITDPAQRVKPGQAVQICIPPPQEARPRPQTLPLAIVFEDTQLIVLDKAAGMVVHPAPGAPDGTVVNALLAHCGAHLSGIGGVRRPGIVHRLDKDTSGLMVVAKDDATHRALAAQFADRSLSRTYHALVWGAPRPDSGSVEGAIGRDPRDRKKMAIVAQGGKPALTHYRSLHHFGTTATLVECRLATGRTHQIRVHLAAIGHPLIGDSLYAPVRRPAALRALPQEIGRKLATFPRQALHAVALEFCHPTDGQPRFFRSELPDDMDCLIEFLENLNR